MHHEAREPYFECDQNHNPFRQSILTTPIEHVNGFIAVPTGAGLGIDINMDKVMEYSV